MVRKLVSVLSIVALICALMPLSAFAEPAEEDTSSHLPDEYYLTNLGYVTPAKLQSPWGTCWAFAVASAVESSILKASDELGDLDAGDTTGAVSDSDAADAADGSGGSGGEALHPMAAIRSGSVSASDVAGGSGGEDASGAASNVAASDVAGGSGGEAVSMDAPDFSKLNSSIDLSERAIGWFAHEPQTEETGGSQAGEGYVREDSSLLTQFEGGNFSIVTSSLLARQNLLSEQTAPYVYNGYDGSGVPWFRISDNSSDQDARMKDWSLDSNLRDNQDIDWYVSGALELASPAILETDMNTGVSVYTGYDPEATEQMKRAIMDVGALAACINSELSLPTELSGGVVTEHTLGDTINYSTWSQYNSADSFVLNHAISVVGWDDSYPVEAFNNKSGALPPEPGAWLCKNNWGSSQITTENGYPDDLVNWGIPASESSDDATGFFWVSFYDHSISTPVAYEVSCDTDSNLYQYDYLGASEFFYPTTYTSDVLLANVFEVEDTELIESVGGWTFDEGDTIHTYVCILPDLDEEIKQGSQFKEILSVSSVMAEDESTFDIPGYHTIDLAEPVLVYKGERFVVMQQIDTITTTFTGDEAAASYLNLEVAFVDSLEFEKVVSRPNVVSNNGETFVSIHGSNDWRSVDEYNAWYADLKTQGNQPVDMVFGNALIKAVTKDSTMGSDSQIYEHVKIA